MAKKVTALIKLQVPAAKATPAPPIGPALGQHGVNIPGFCKEFNDRTAKQAGLIDSEGNAIRMKQALMADAIAQQPAAE